MKPKYEKIEKRALAIWDYWCHGVWSDTRPLFKVNVVKTLNITINSFLNTNIQSQACALTYKTMLAVVPALAMLFAIGRGFGFQNLLQDELYRMLPSQKIVINKSLVFVDSYLNQASEGIFVGVGLVFLLWTLISLISSVEDSFNLIWDIKQGRNIWRKITDYTAMFLILPVLMVCGSGFAIFLNNSIQALFDIPFMTPVISALFELASYFFTCMFFAAVFMLIPNTKVKFKYAFMSGVFTGTAFLILQWLFVSGQLYVSKYNAIYGSFSFLPLLLLWLQLVWVICLTGALICYASQNIFAYSFSEQIKDISRDYQEKVTIAIATLVVKNFVAGNKPITIQNIILNFGIPSRLATQITDTLCEIGIFVRVVIDEKHEVYGYQPAIEPDKITVNTLHTKLNTVGYKNFIPKFDKHFSGVVKTVEDINMRLERATHDMKLEDIEINIERHLKDDNQDDDNTNPK